MPLRQSASAAQVSPFEQPPQAPPQSVVSTGQTALAPVQASAGSHAPVESRHTAPTSSTSTGQAAPPPGQSSARSQSPAAARQTVPRSYFRQAPAPSQPPA